MINHITRKVLASAGVTFGGKRDLYEIFGFKRNLMSSDFRHRYERGGIAQRIVDIYPEACWATPPQITDTPDKQELSQWDDNLMNLVTNLNLWTAIRTADILAQINSYSILLLGVTGSDNLEEEMNASGEIVYIKPFGSDVAQIDQWEDDETNERFGLPKVYKLTIAGSGRKSTKTIKVHHSRVIHVSQRNLEDPVNGQPFLKPIWNILDSLEKVESSAGELWWLNGRAGLNLNVDTEVDLGVDDKDALKQQVDDYQHKMTRVIRTQGVDVKALTMDVPNPKDHVSTYLSLICGATGIPLRMLTGSERGELASTQDDNNFNSRVKERRSNFCEPVIIYPLFEKLTSLGVLKNTKWEIIWPELDVVSEKDEAAIAIQKAQAIATYTNAPASESVISPQQFVEDILKMEYRESELLDMQALEDNDLNLEDNDKGLRPNQDPDLAQ